MKSLHSKTYFFSCLLSLVLFSCSDIIEKSLFEHQVNVQSPANNVVLSNYNVTFVWDKIEHALQYHLQIVQPSFNKIDKILTDTTLLTNKFETILEAGEYQWRIKAENGSSKTEYTTWNFTIDTNKNISNITMIVNSPVNNFITNSNLIQFHWLAIPYADTYEYTVKDTIGNILKVLSTSQTRITDTLNEGIYYWTISGNSGGISTKPSIPRKFEIDQTPPIQPLLSLPTNNSVLQSPIIFSWTSEIKYRDSIIIATDSVFSNISHRAQVSDVTTLTIPLTPNKYYWKVRTFDNANNASPYSLISKFTVSQ